MEFYNVIHNQNSKIHRDELVFTPLQKYSTDICNWPHSRPAVIVPAKARWHGGDEFLTWLGHLCQLPISFD